MSYQAKAAQYKVDEVSTLLDLIKEYPVIGILNVENLPSQQLQALRSKLRKDFLIRVSKKELIGRAIEQAKDKDGFEKFKEMMEGMPALLFTTQDPFKISNKIRTSKSKAPAKSGQTAPFDLVIEAGPTPFTPGPIISELGALGLKTGVENGKIVIKEASVLVRKGEVISASAADTLTKFDIQPMDIGLDLVAAYENGLIYGREVLGISPEEYLSMIQAAASESMALSLEISYPTADNVSRLIGLAYNTAKNFALNQNVMSDVLLEKNVGDAERSAKAIATAAKYDPSSGTEASKEPEGSSEGSAGDNESGDGSGESSGSSAEDKGKQKSDAEQDKQERQEKPADVKSESGTESGKKED